MYDSAMERFDESPNRIIGIKEGTIVIEEGTIEIEEGTIELEEEVTPGTVMEEEKE